MNIATDLPIKKKQFGGSSNLSLEEMKETLSNLNKKLNDLEVNLAEAKDKEQRAIADYHNLSRRNQQEQMRWAKFATKNLVADLLEPLSHLQLAANQLQDKGLAIVCEQLWQILANHGLERMSVIKEPFDVLKMEVIESEEGVTEETGIVSKVVQDGYLLNDEVIQHAKVILGRKNSKE